MPTHSYISVSVNVQVMLALHMILLEFQRIMEAEQALVLAEVLHILLKQQTEVFYLNMPTINLKF